MFVLKPPRIKSTAYFKLLFLLFVFAFALRVLLALPAARDPERLCRPDSASYLQPALALIGDDALRSPFSAATPLSEEELFSRPPGYPLLLAGLLALFRGSVAAIFLAGCLIGAATIFPIAACGRILAGRVAGLAAAAFHSLNLTAISSAPLILSDALLGLFCALMTQGLLIALRRRSLKAFSLAALAAAAGLLVKPVMLPVLAVLLPFLLSWILLRDARKTFAAAAFCLVLVVACLFCGFLFRGGQGGFWVVDPNSGMTATHNAAAILAHATGENGDAVRARLIEEADAEFAAREELRSDPNARNAWLLARWLRIAREHPASFLRTHFLQVGILLPDLPTFSENLGLSSGGRGTLAVLRQNGLLAAFRHYAGSDGPLLLLCASPFLLATLLLYVASLCFLAFSVARRRWRLLALFLIPVVWFLTAPGPVLMPRYQLPTLPLLCATAGAALLLRRIPPREKNQS